MMAGSGAAVVVLGLLAAAPVGDHSRAAPPAVATVADTASEGAGWARRPSAASTVILPSEQVQTVEAAVRERLGTGDGVEFADLASNLAANGSVVVCGRFSMKRPLSPEPVPGMFLGRYDSLDDGDDPSPTFTVTSLATDPSNTRLLASTCAGHGIDLPDD